MKMYSYCTKEPISFLVADANLACPILLSITIQKKLKTNHVAYILKSRFEKNAEKLTLKIHNTI